MTVYNQSALALASNMRPTDLNDAIRRLENVKGVNVRGDRMRPGVRMRPGGKPQAMRRMLKRWPWLAGYLPKPRACVWIHPAYWCRPWRIQCAYCDRRRPQIERGCARTPCCDGPDRTCHHEYDAWRPGNYWRPPPDGACMRCGAPRLRAADAGGAGGRLRRMYILP